MSTLTEEPATTTVPADVEAMDRIVKRFRATAKACNAQLSLVVTEDRELRELSSSRGGLCDGQFIDEDAAARLAESQVIGLAEASFAVPGAVLRIDGNEIPALDPSDLWRWLVGTYGKGKAAVAAYHPLAKEFVAALRIDKDDELKCIGGRLSFKKYISYAKGLGLEYHSARDLKIIIEGFATIALWADCWTDLERKAAAEVAASARYLNSSIRYSTKRIEIGTSVLICPCQTSWDFRLSLEFAEKVQLFLAEFGGFEK